MDGTQQKQASFTQDVEDDKAINELVDQYIQDSERLKHRCKNFSYSASKFINSKDVEEGWIKTEMTQIEEKLKQQLKTVKDLNKEYDGYFTDAYSNLIDAKRSLEGNGPGGDLRRFVRQQKNPLLLRILLGDRVQISQVTVDQVIRMKENYHNFRDNVAYIMLVWPLILYYLFYGNLNLLQIQFFDQNLNQYILATQENFFPLQMFMAQLYLTWMTYVYISLGLRENVLLMSGSNIRPWWIQHHYCSALVSIWMVTLPLDSPLIMKFYKILLPWASYQAIVMILQSRYQRQRLYTRVAMGKDQITDVISGESSGVPGQLLLLYPIILLLQIWQFVTGILMVLLSINGEGDLNFHINLAKLRKFTSNFASYEYGTRTSGQKALFFLGIIYGLLALANFLNTVDTLAQKNKVKRRMTKRRMSSYGSQVKLGLESQAAQRSASLNNLMKKNSQKELLQKNEQKLQKDNLQTNKQDVGQT